MKILITGINGQVGHALMHQLTEHELISLTRKDCDFTNTDQIKQIIDKHQPDLIINPAAYTNVDKAEDETELAFQINCHAPRILAEKSLECKIPFIHFSTDYVFDGKKKGAYYEDNQTNPLGVYGKSKLAGERAIEEVGGQFYIFRTSWVYSNIGNNFYSTIKRLSHERDIINVIEDQKGVPTSNQFIAEELEKIIPQLNVNDIGTYHLVPDGKCSWYEFAKAIIIEENPSFNIDNCLPIQTHEYMSKTNRPLNSHLNNSKVKKTFMLKFDPWQRELKKVINES